MGNAPGFIPKQRRLHIMGSYCVVLNGWLDVIGDFESDSEARRWIKTNLNPGVATVMFRKEMADSLFRFYPWGNQD